MCLQVGLCEEAELVTVVVEAAGPSLKQQLLDSRALEHQPEWAAQHGRYSSLREETVLEILTGVAEGLRHLADRGVSAGGSGGGDLTHVLYCSVSRSRTPPSAAAPS